MRRAAVVLSLWTVACTRPAARCDVTGDWRANLEIYDGTAHIESRGDGAIDLELVGKATQHERGRRVDDRHLELAHERCEISPDCKRIRCDAPDGHELFALFR